MTLIDVIDESQKHTFQCFKNYLGIVPCCLAKPAIFTFRFRQEWNLLVFETSTDRDSVEENIVLRRNSRK